MTVDGVCVCVCQRETELEPGKKRWSESLYCAQLWTARAEDSSWCRLHRCDPCVQTARKCVHMLPSAPLNADWAIRSQMRRLAQCEENLQCAITLVNTVMPIWETNIEVCRLCTYCFAEWSWMKSTNKGHLSLFHHLPRLPSCACSFCDKNEYLICRSAQVYTWAYMAVHLRLDHQRWVCQVNTDYPAFSGDEGKKTTF